MNRLLLALVCALFCSGCAAFSFPETVPNAFRARTNTDPTGPATSSNGGRALGDVVVTSDLDDDGCAVDSLNRVDASDAIYVALEPSDIQAGMTFFARLYDETRVLEDADELTADQAYDNVCVNFVFEADEPWPVGEYQVEMFVNGNSYQTVDFSVR